MTAFLIAVIILIIVASNSKFNALIKDEAYRKKQKTNVKLEYDIACDVIERMARRYRELASRYTTTEYLSGIIYKHDQKDYFESVQKLFKADWDKVINIAYNNKFWDMLPRDGFLNVDNAEILINEFKIQFNIEAAMPLIKECVETKELLIINSVNAPTPVRTYRRIFIERNSENSEWNRIKNVCCWYNSMDLNKNIVEIILKEYDMPTTKEMDELYLNYSTLSALAGSYAHLQISKKGYLSTHPGHIQPNPPQWLKEKVYNLKSKYEQEKENYKRSVELRNKYPTRPQIENQGKNIETHYDRVIKNKNNNEE